MCIGFISKATGRAQVPLKDGTKNFRNSSLFERFGYFHMTISENFECYKILNEYFTSEIMLSN